MTKVAKKKARRLGRTIRKTLGTLFLISALVVAAIPVDYLQAEGEDVPNVDVPITTYTSPEITVDIFDYIPQVDTNATIYSTGDGMFQFAYVSEDGKEDSATRVAVILGYQSIGELEGRRLVIPNTVDAYLKFSSSDGTTTGYAAVNKKGEFLYYKTYADTEYVRANDGSFELDENGNRILKTDAKPTFNLCNYNSWQSWGKLEANEYYFYQGNIVTPDVEPSQTLEEEKQPIRDALVCYIGSQYLTEGSGTNTGTWYLDPTANIVEKPEQGVFYRATNIESLVIGSSINGIGNYAFHKCSLLNNITLGNGLKAIGNYAFSDCLNLVTATIDVGAGVKTIGDHAFYNCQGLTEFNMPVAVEEIGDSAFENCQAMKNIYLNGESKPEGNYNVLLSKIGRDVFKGCSSLEGITFPPNFTNQDSDGSGEGSVDVSVFRGCSSLKYIETLNGEFNLSANNGFSFDDLKSTVPTTFYLRGFKDNALHETATSNRIPFSFYDDILGKNVYELTVVENEGQSIPLIYRVSEDNQLVYFRFKFKEGEPYDPSIIPTVILPTAIGPQVVSAIAPTAFQDNCYLKTIVIPESVNNIMSNAFKGCHNLEDVIFENPPEDMVIGAGAFKTQNVGVHQADCTNKTHTVPDETHKDNKTPHLNFVGPISNSSVPFVYAMTPSENINAGEQDLTYITYQSGWPTNLEVRYNPTTDKNELVDYPTIKALQSGIYCEKGGLDNSGYAYITKKYADAAVSAADKYVNGGTDFTEDENNVLSAALNLVLPDGIEAIGTVVTDEGVKGLFEYKEKEETTAGNLRKTIIAEGIEQVQENAFKGCIYLKGITFSDKTTSIGNHAFEDCVELQDVSIPATVSEMGLSPFRGCEILRDVNFNESPYFACENSVIFELGEEGVHTALVEYLNGKVPHIVNSEDVEGITSIYPEAFMYSNIESADLSTANLEEIPVSAFQGAKSLFSVTLPNGCRRVNENAFADSNIRQLVVPSTVNVINDKAFAHINSQNPEYAALTFYCQEGTVAEDYAKSYGINISYKLPEYEVKLYDEEGNLVTSIYVEQGLPLEIPEDLENLPPTKDYTRLTWTPPAGTIITGPTNVYASYVPMEPSEYQKVVNFIAFDKETILSTQTVTPGENAVPPQPPEEAGYEFTGWFGEQIGEDMLVTDEMVSPVTIYAQYEKIDSLANTHTVTFLDYDNTFLYTQSVEHGKDATAPRTPSREGYTFKEWLPYPVNVTEDITVVAQYTSNDSGNTNPTGSPNPGTSGSPSPSPTPGTSGSPTPGTSGSPSPTPGGGNNTGSSNNTLYTLTVRNGSGSGQYAAGSQIIVVADEPGRSMEFDGWTVSPSSTSVTDKSLSAMAITMPANDVAVIANYKSRTTGTGNTSSTNTNRPTGSTGTVNRGGTTVVIDKNGLSNTGVVSATVNGSSDNFTIKITESSDATEAVLRALQAEYGSLENVKYFPMDISLYDSTGNNKITDTTGLSVSITLPLPDSLITYAGNNKVAGVVNDKLDKLTPRFTTISGVSCITFTAEHFSPYVIYVDVTNLSDGTISDNTPTTGDGIHPKWFLSIGLACLSFVMFAMKDTRKKQKVKVRA